MSDQLVFAHWFSPYPISLDNKTPAGDWYSQRYMWPYPGGCDPTSAVSYCGYLRDRPLGREPLTGDWETKDILTDIGNAQAAGLSGFTVDILKLDTSTAMPDSSGAQRHRRLVKKLLAAAQGMPGFKIQLMPDISSLKAETPENVAAMCRILGAYSSAHRLDDGRLVVSPFKAEQWSPALWQRFVDAMGGADAVALVPVFLNYSANVVAFKVQLGAAMYGASNWGNRSPAGNVLKANTDRIADAHSRGLIWMQPVSVQDERPNQQIYDEACNTENLRLTWQAAIEGRANWVQIVTWNDYSEGAHIAPSMYHGDSYLMLCAYYGEWFRTGAQPAILKDRLYVTHRRHPHAAVPTIQRNADGTVRSPMKLRGGSSSPRDTLEVLAFLTSPAELEIVSGTATTKVSAPGGISAHLVPLQPGTQSATARRAA